MTDHMTKQFAGYMTSCYGPAWAVRIPSDQLAETRQAFWMGALAYQGLILGVMGPNAGDLTADEAARGERLMAEINDEIEAFGRNRIHELFERTTNGGGRA